MTLAAQEDGLLQELAAQEGTSVAARDVVAKFDDRQADVQLKIAKAQLAVAEQKCANDVDVRLAEAEAAVKKFEHDNALAANARVADVVGQVEIKRLLLGFREAELKAEKARRDLDVLAGERQVRDLETDAAQLGLDKRTVRSPIDGVVVQRFVDQGEWLKTGEPICRIVRLDTLWVEGLLEAAVYRTDQVEGRAVDVEVALAGKRREQLRGDIVFVDPQIDGNGRFRVRAKVANRRQGGHWVLLPGHLAEMIVRSLQGS
ncbi:MAG: HlyD family efflux transporter periplasmic adaptor subunit [Planctomycetales bacterium]|nr:HlyD family efflux transporter periplasmic adaptor subunit [Planctomycetales bacterium]MBN8629072.1 HlyD family efflux transporter periplasmic adaptor subunit [Planctomycetota bacterium]